MCKFDKNSLYLTSAIADVIMADFPGRFSSKGSCMTNVAKSITRLGLTSANRQKKYRAYAGKDAQAIYDDMSKIARSTPIEAAVKDAEKELTAQPDEPIVTKPEITDEDLERHAREQIEKNKKNIPEPDELGPLLYIDPLAVYRKRFYTDTRFFLKLAQTPEERVAIWNALGGLYGGATQTGGKS